MSVEAPTRAVTPLSLLDYTSPALVIPRLAHRDAAGILGELSSLLQQQGCVTDLLPFYHAAFNQELLANSSSECGIAYPHARLSGVRDLRFAFGRTEKPVPWGGRGSWPVEFVFLLAVPATDAARYLHLLASIARLNQRPETLEELRRAAGKEEVLKLFRNVGIRQT
jgi:mannitol/fructose-specific phosphotransferase system IIA component (Ntr-type)